MIRNKNLKLFRITTVPISMKMLLTGQLHFMSRQGFEVTGVASGEPELVDVEKNEGVKVEAIEMTRTITPIKDIKALWQFYRMCKREKPTIVHSHTPKAGIIGMLGAKLAGVPIRLHTVAGMPLMEANGIKRILLNIVEKLTYYCATKVYPNSIGLYNFINQNKFINPKKLKIIGHGSSNGIDTSQFDPDLIPASSKIILRQELEISINDFVFLFVGRVVADKGINELVQAFANIDLIAANHNTIPNCHLVIVGNFENDLDPLDSNTEALINSHFNIHTVGYKVDVARYFAIADVLTFPSYREGFPNVVMQAAAMELTAIVTDINGCNEIITNGKNGWLVPVKDTKRLEERMLWCLKHNEESKAMGKRSRELMREKYERQFVWEELLKEYMDLLRTSC